MDIIVNERSWQVKDAFADSPSGSSVMNLGWWEQNSGVASAPVALHHSC